MVVINVALLVVFAAGFFHVLRTGVTVRPPQATGKPDGRALRRAITEPLSF